MPTVIVNPASAGGRTARRWRRIVTALEDAYGRKLDVRLTTGPRDGIAIARRLVDEDGERELVVLGGDGTLGEVVAGCARPDGRGMLRDDLEIAVVHQGTGGDLARGLGLPRDEAGAVAVAVNGARRRIDVGMAVFDEADPHGQGMQRSRAFVSCANVGMAAEVAAIAIGPVKRFGRGGAFTAATVACLARNRPRTVRLTADALDVELQVVDIDICNNAWMGAGMHVAPNSLIDDGEFDVVLITAASRLRLLRLFPSIYVGKHINAPEVRVIRAKHLAIDVPRDGAPEGVVLDGELVGTTPATFSVLPSAISFRVSR